MTNKDIEYSIRLKTVFPPKGKFKKLKMRGELVIITGFESLFFCLRKDDVIGGYLIDELSTGHFAACGENKKNAIASLRRILKRRGIVSVEKTIAKKISKYGRMNAEVIRRIIS